MVRAAKREDDLSTVKGRIRAALATRGISTVPELQRKWKEAFSEDLGRQTAHRWLDEDKPVKFVEPKYLFKLGTLTAHSEAWIALGEGSPAPRREVTPDQAEVLDLFDGIKGQRRDNWLSTGRDYLAAQQGNNTSVVRPFRQDKTNVK